ADRRTADTREVATQVAGTAREVEDTRAGGEPELRDGAGPPPPIEAEGNDAVHAVVAGRQAVEHALDRGAFAFALRHRAVAPEHRRAHAMPSQPGSPRAAASSLGSPTASRCSCATSSSTLRKWLATKVVAVGNKVRNA